jgi:hypothetical protein
MDLGRSHTMADDQTTRSATRFRRNSMIFEELRVLHDELRAE